MTPTPAHITTHGLGPHAQPVTVTLAPGGTTITAPSQAGKSRATVHALCLALTGRAPDAGAVDLRDITDGVDRAIARYLGPARGDGAVYGVRAELRASGTASAALTVLSMTRDAQGKAQVQTVAGPAGQAEHLAALGMSGPIIRAIIVPGAAAGLATGTPDGRGLRDVLAEVLPAQDLGAEVQSRLTAQGLALKPDDPLTLGKTAATKGSALAAQAAANKAAAQADGAATALAAAAARAREAREAVRGSAPDLERVRKAEAWLSVYTEWQAYDDALTKHAQAVAAHTAAAEALVAWQARRGALGPAPSTADVQAAEAALAAAKASKAEADAAVVELRLARTTALRQPVPAAADVDRAQRAVADLTGRLAAARGKAAALAQGRGTDDAPRHTCPTCGQAISDAEGRRQDALALAAAGDVAGIETMLGDAQRELEAARGARDEQAAAVRAQHDAAVTEAERVAEVAAGAVAEAATTRAVARQGPDAHAAAVRALGPAPSRAVGVALEAAPAPVAPSSPRPDCRHLEAAQQLVQRAQDHARALTHAEVTAADAGAAERAAAGTAQTAAREAERVEALVRALREAPGEMLRRSQALVAVALQGTGVEVVMAQDGDALTLTIDGRPWAQASTGRQTLADYQLRVALRGLAHTRHPGLPFLKYADLPVVIDNAQSWSGSWPAAAHPAALLVTGAGQGAGLRAGPWPGA
jgi:hypothetical protein